MDKTKKRDSSQSTENALRLIDCFIDKEECGISELSRELGLGKTSVARLVVALESRKFLMINPATRKYRLGIRMMLFGSLCQERHELAHASSAAMLALSQKYQATTHLSVRYGTEVMVINKISSGPFIYMSSRVGATLSTYASASGKCILAFSSIDQIEQCIKDVRLLPLTTSTITDIPSFMSELERIHHCGYAVDDEEDTDGLYCVAAPIFDLSGNPIAAISVSGGTTVLKGKTEGIAKDLIRAADQIASG